jgi:hypothetical protein
VIGLMRFKRLLGGVFDEDETVRCATSVEDADMMLDHWETDPLPAHETSALQFSLGRARGAGQVSFSSRWLLT